MSSRAFTDDICRTLPGAVWADHSEGALSAWKLSDKMFACIGMRGDGVSLKTPSAEDAALLIEMGRAIKAPYFHRSWIRIPFGSVEDDEMRDRIITSYRLIRAALPKKIQATLDPL